MISEPSRHSHANLDLSYRRLKAEKIERILSQQGPLAGLNVLEIGAGSGVISSYLSEVVGANGRVSAVDVVDERVVTQGYEFIPVKGVRLPFADHSFDLVISNHVIEHVGAEPEQLMHLAEMARVLRTGGIGYLAVPNRWALVEPHFRLWFLSWLPQSLRDLYVRAAGKGDHYDCRPPGPLSIRAMLRRSGLRFRDRSYLAVRLVAEIEHRSLLARISGLIPTSVLKAFGALYPTMVFVLTKS